MNPIEKELDRIFEHFDDVSDEQTYDFFCTQEDGITDNEHEWRQK